MKIAVAGVSAMVYGGDVATADRNADFDTLGAAKTLREAGFDQSQAEGVAGVVRDGRAGLATKADIAAVRADLRADIAALRADIYRALRMQGAGLVAVMAALRLFG